MLNIGIAAIPLFYLMIWSYHEGTLKPFIISTIFICFILFSFIFDLYKNLYPSGASFTKNAFSWSLGGFLGYLFGWLGSQGASMFAMPKQSLLSQISGELPPFWDSVVNIKGAAVSEELLFIIAIPTMIIFGLRLLSRRFEFFDNPWVETTLVMIIITPLFYWFHVGKLAITSFITAVIAFRLITVSFTWGEKQGNLLPFVSILPAFAFGFHEFNNIASQGGFVEYASTLIYKGPHFFGVAILVVYVILFMAAAEYVLRKQSPQFEM